MIKRGLSATVEEWLLAAEYVAHSGNLDIILCERGIRTFEPSTRNTLDLSAVVVAQERSHLPVIVDPSHGTGGRTLVAPMALAAVAAGADGIMVDVHADPALGALRRSAGAAARRGRRARCQTPGAGRVERPAGGPGQSLPREVETDVSAEPIKTHRGAGRGGDGRRHRAGLRDRRLRRRLLRHRARRARPPAASTPRPAGTASRAASSAGSSPARRPTPRPRGSRSPSTFEEAASTDLVIEAVPERLDLKIRVFRDLDRAAPAAHDPLLEHVRASRSRRSAAATDRPDRVVGWHWASPAPVMKLAEIVRTARDERRDHRDRAARSRRSAARTRSWSRTPRWRGATSPTASTSR